MPCNPIIKASINSSKESLKLNPNLNQVYQILSVLDTSVSSQKNLDTTHVLIYCPFLTIQQFFNIINNISPDSFNEKSYLDNTNHICINYFSKKEIKERFQFKQEFQNEPMLIWFSLS